ncbi:hypothetical protein D3C74_382710 [compost metagenome]
MTPAAPMGSSGAKFPALKAVKATITKKIRIAIFTSTMMVLAIADSRAPRTSRTVASTTTINAERLITPPSPGPPAKLSGNDKPKICMVWFTEAPAPTATAAAETAYSKTRHQPQIQATPSPRVA